MRRSLISFTFILSLLSNFTKAQDTTPLPQWSLKFSPQHLLMNTFRMEAEKVIIDKQFSVTAAPFILSGDMWENHPKDDVWGMGAEVTARGYIVNNDKNFKGVYGSIGLNYHHYNLKARDYGWIPVEEDGLQYIKYGLISRPVEVQRVGIVFMFGYQLNIKDIVLLDFYHGFGIKKSFSPQGKYALERYDNGFLDYSYSGLDPRLGVKIGFILK